MATGRAAKMSMDQWRFIYVRAVSDLESMKETSEEVPSAKLSNESVQTRLDTLEAYSQHLKTNHPTAINLFEGLKENETLEDLERQVRDPKCDIIYIYIYIHRCTYMCAYIYVHVHT